MIANDYCILNRVGQTKFDAEVDLFKRQPLKYDQYAYAFLRYPSTSTQLTRGCFERFAVFVSYNTYTRLIKYNNLKFSRNTINEIGCNRFLT